MALTTPAASPPAAESPIGLAAPVAAITAR